MPCDITHIFTALASEGDHCRSYPATAARERQRAIMLFEQESMSLPYTKENMEVFADLIKLSQMPICKSQQKKKRFHQANYFDE
jgi:hypothetical protein